jgi:hypothetical protein
MLDEKREKNERNAVGDTREEKNTIELPEEEKLKI